MVELAEKEGIILSYFEAEVYDCFHVLSMKTIEYKGMIWMSQPCVFCLYMEKNVHELESIQTNQIPQKYKDLNSS
jgi:hypothetical protein